MDKFESAIREYGRAQREIKRLSVAIGDARVACSNEQFAKTGVGEFSNIVDHLQAAYEFLYDDDEQAYRVTGEEPGAYLAHTCPHCLAAHNLIQERKAAKQRFGVAKRRITLLGRVA